MTGPDGFPLTVGIWVLMVAADVSGLGEGMAGVEGMGEFAPSAIGSREMEKLDVEAFGVGEKGESDTGGFRSCNCN